jgi:hypothetical protein
MKEIQSSLSCADSKQVHDKTALDAQCKDNLNDGLSCISAAGRRPYIIGVDPGVKGAVAVYDAHAGSLVRVFDMPTYDIKVKGNTRARIDFLSLALKIDAYSPMVAFALIEDVGQVGTNADPFSAFVFGFATGGVHGVLAACLIPIQKVKPSVWKAEMGLTANKAESIALAHKLVPESKSEIHLKKHDGRAEAVLLAAYAVRKLKKGK